MQFYKDIIVAAVMFKRVLCTLYNQQELKFVSDVLAVPFLSSNLILYE